MRHLSISIRYKGTILWILVVQSDTVNDLVLFADHCDLTVTVARVPGQPF